MKKKAKPKKYEPDEEVSSVNEPLAVYRPIKMLPDLMDFPYRRFAKIADRVPFSQREWAAILHLSEKTLQRYSKDNKNFEGIYVERILQMEEMIKIGLETFTSSDAFYHWLKKDKPMLGIVLRFSDLQSHKGIQEHIDAMERLQQGIII